MTKSGNCRSKMKDRRPARIRSVLAATALFSALILNGCLGSGSSGQVARSPEGPAMDLAMGLYQRGESLQSLAVRGGASYTVGQRRHYFKFEALAIKPGWLLFTAFDPAGRPAFKLASDGSQLSGINYSSNQYVVGPATAENFGRFIPLGLSPDQLVALMSGSQVRPAAAGAKESGSVTELTVAPADYSGAEGNMWRIRVAGGLGQDPASAEIQSATFGPARNPEISIKYPTIRQVPREDLGGQPEPFPATVEADWQGDDNKKQSLRVTYEEVRLGLTLDQNLFRLEQPQGFELVQLY